MKRMRRIGVTTILDPQGLFLRKWNKILALFCLTSVSLDHLLFYTPFVDGQNLCFSIATQFVITLCVLRSLIDAAYVFHIFLKFRTGFISPHTRVFVDNSKAIIKRYLQSHFIVDILSVLPLPQVAMVIPAVRTLVEIRTLVIIIIAQNLVRILRVVPLYIEVTRTSAIINEKAWGGAAANFAFYMIAAHVIGAFWYLASVERTEACWRYACRRSGVCNPSYLYCGGNNHGSNSFLSSCTPPEQGESDFHYGIYRNALKFQIHRQFSRRVFFCFVWGLRNLSSLGQNLETSEFGIGESCFVVVISFMGLILFSFLAGNIQRYLQCLTVRGDEMRVKLRDREQWMSRTMLPQSLRSRVRQHEQYIWVKSRGVDEESLICDLPMDLRRDIKRHQCCRLLRSVPMLDKMDEQAMDLLCCCLKRVFYTAHTILEREGFPVDQMLFIESGSISITTTSNLDSLNNKVDKFCGEELLTWAMDPNSSSYLPISTRTLLTVDDVEGFSLTRDDLKCLVSQFRHLQGEQMFRASGLF